MSNTISSSTKPSSSNSSRMILLVSSSAAALGLLVYFLVQRNKRLLTRDRAAESIRSIRHYFTSKLTSQTTPNQTTRAAPNVEFRRRIDQIERAISQQSSQRPVSHPISSQDRSNRPVSTRSSDTDQLTRPIERFISLAKCWQRNGHSLEPDPDVAAELGIFLDILLSKFDSLDPNRSREVSAELAAVAQLSSFQHSSILTLKRLVLILDAHFTPLNLDLFAQYAFNNARGESCTDVLVDLLSCARSLAADKPLLDELIDDESLVDRFLRLLHTYVLELDRSGHNVRRARKLNTIKTSALDILSRLLAGVRGRKQATGRFVSCLSELEAIEFPVVDLKHNGGRLRCSSISLESRFEVLEAYVRFVESFLILVEECSASGVPCESGMLGYLMSAKFYARLDECFKLSTINQDESLRARIESVFLVWNQVNSNLNGQKEEVKEISSNNSIVL